MGRLSGNTEFSDLAQAVERMRVRLEDKAYVENYVHTLTHELVHGFQYDGETFRSVDVPGATATRVFGINAHGDMVGGR